MLQIIIAALVMLCVILAGKLAMVKKDVRQMALSIEKIKPAESSQQLRTESQDKDLAALARGVNNLYFEIAAEKIKHIEAMKASKQSMANISHDLRTPLTAIIGYLRLLESGNNSIQQEKQYLDICIGKAASLHLLVVELFELSRLESGSHEFDMEMADVAGILREELSSVYEELSSLAQEPQITVPDYPLWIISDKAAVSRVFGNLLNNICKHGDGKGVSITAGSNNGNAEIRFSNNAENLSMEDVKHLFERFFVADRMRSRKNTGLGLSICRELVEQTGGNISAVLENGKLIFVLRWEEVRIKN